MATNAVSAKRMLIDKANARIVASVGVAAFILVFSLVASKTLISQAAYQNRVIGKKRAVVAQLQSDISATTQLKTAYQSFIDKNPNVLGGKPDGEGAQDGTNAKIVLDALPSRYDFPGLTTSLDTLLSSPDVTVGPIGGTDDEVAQSANQTSISPQPVPMPFSVSVQGSYKALEGVVNAFQNSIRPMQIQTMSIAGVEPNLTLNVTAQTYYQPAKSLNISKQVVK